jgi:4-alpha-glucanotransferase
MTRRKAVEHVDFVLGLHCHQPVGNFPEVIEAAYQDAYLPFLEAFEPFAGLKAVFHFTGPLIEFLDAAHPDFLDRLADLAASGRVELLGGGFYEPILALVPPADAREQLQRMHTTLQDRLGYDAQGVWLAERVWEPSLASLLSECNVRYLPIDDTHFQRVGLDAGALHGHYLTEDQGKPVGVFPISGALRYLVPFHPVAEVIDHFRMQAAAQPHPLLVLVDDGEKFGVWPGTKDWVYRDGWLERFFAALEENRAWLHTVTLADAFARRGARGRVYLPTTSYFELGEWALPSEGAKRLDALKEVLGERLAAFRPLLSGGYFRNFLSKYPEADYMHKRMLQVSGLLQGLDAGGPSAARTHLLEAQSNDAYWHGLFGGIYLPHLRDAVWHHLLAAQAAAERTVHGAAPWHRVRTHDVDADGQDELQIDTERFTLVASPRRGGALYELSDKAIGFNFLNTVARRPEAYHARVAAAGRDATEVRSIHERVVAKQEGLERFLIYDRHRRCALVDRLLSPNATLAEISTGSPVEIVSLLDRPYTYTTEPGGETIRLACTAPAPGGPVRIEKTLRVGADTIDIDLRLERPDGDPLRARLATEFNLAMLAGNAPDHYFDIPHRPLADPRLASTGTESAVGRVRLVNDWDGWSIAFRAHPDADLWRYPIHTVNNSEAGFELVYQASCLLFTWPVDLRPGEAFTAGLEMAVTRGEGRRNATDIRDREARQ